MFLTLARPVSYVCSWLGVVDALKYPESFTLDSRVESPRGLLAGDACARDIAGEWRGDALKNTSGIEGEFA